MSLACGPYAGCVINGFHPRNTKREGGDPVHVGNGKIPLGNDVHAHHDSKYIIGCAFGYPNLRNMKEVWLMISMKRPLWVRRVMALKLTKNAVC